MPRRESACFCFSGSRKSFTDGSESIGIGSRVGAWDASDMLLIDGNDLVDILPALDAVMLPYLF